MKKLLTRHLDYVNIYKLLKKQHDKSDEDFERNSWHIMFANRMVPMRNENLEAELLGHWQNANAYTKMPSLMNASIQRENIFVQPLSLLVP